MQYRPPQPQGRPFLQLGGRAQGEHPALPSLREDSQEAQLGPAKWRSLREFLGLDHSWTGAYRP